MISDVERIIATEAIMALKARYCWYCDDPAVYDRFPSLFTDDAVFIEEPLDEMHGKAEIVAFNERYAEEVAWSRHYAVAPLIEVADDGATATGRWQALLLSAQLIDGEEQMLWASGTYVEEYRKVGDDWLFSRIHASGRWMTSFEDGLRDEIDPDLFG